MKRSDSKQRKAHSPLRVRANCNVRTLVLLVSLGGGLPGAMATTAEEQLRQAAQAYKDAEATTDRSQRLEGFRKAQLLFSRMVNSDQGAILNPDLYANVGNAALRAEHLGGAVIAFHRALLLDPDHRRATQNLQYARSLLPDWVPRPESDTLLNSFFAVARRLTRQEMSLLAGLAFCCAALLIAASIRWRQVNLRYLAILPSLVWIGLVLFGFAGQLDDAADLAVVVAEVTAKTSDSTNSPDRFPEALPGGTEVRILENRDDWMHVRLSDGRDAWLPASSVEKVTN